MIERDVDEGLTFHIMLAHTGLARWQWAAARAGGLIPGPDTPDRAMVARGR